MSRPVRRHLALFAAALALPILVFVATLSNRFADAQRSRLSDEALNTARAVALAVDRELTGMAATLNLLALSPQLRAGDLEGFHRQAIELRLRLGVATVLRDATGRQRLNAWLAPGQLPPGTSPLPPPQPGGRLAVTNLFQGMVYRVPMFAVEVPVEVPLPGETGLAFLSLSAPAQRIRQVLEDRQAPEGWTLAVVDGAGRILARNRRHEEFVGQPATDDLRQNATGWEGNWHGFTADGMPVLGSYAKTALADWRIAVGVPLATLNAPLHRTLLLLGGVGLALAALSVMLALVLGNRIADPLRRLAAQAAALGRGEPVEPVQTSIREVAESGAALAEASRTIRRREEDLRRLNDALETRVGERTRDLAETNARLIAAATGRERAEAQLRQSQKMEAVGRLTGGVAHDFNNLLTVVLGNLALARRRLGELEEHSPATERIGRGIDNAVEGANRAAILTQRLLAFSRQQPLAPEAVDANRLVAGMSDLLRRTLGEDIEIETVLSGGLWRAHADPNQLESSLLNLAVNARDAMPAGGKLTIETANAYLDEAYAAGREDVDAGQYVLICVSDTGTGMSPEVVTRAFEPFFTTKPTGKGTGLGLSQVYGFARQSGGHAAIYSEPGQGSTVKLYLPRLRDAELPAAAGTQAQPAAPGTGLHTGRGAVVLVVEDEEMVRDFAVTALEEAGCRTIAAGDGPSALALLSAHPEVTLLFTDVVLAGPMNGRELAAAALARRPRLLVLFTTGYTRNAIIHHGRLDEGVNFLGKPYTASALLERISRLLA
ncbi:hybrid sensor histidine kinase/response regulator [Falsiroseomonas frigidaquae]